MKTPSATMSCEAEAKATNTAINAMVVMAVPGEYIAIHAMPPISASCVISSQPRRRPRKGGA